MNRIYHAYTSWEEVPAGMWRKVSAKDEPALLKRAIVFTADAHLYGAAMLKVIDAWPISCENTLSGSGNNRRAWIGHAAVALELNIPEAVTRRAWGMLTDQQRIDANFKADEAILLWEQRQKLKNI